MRLPFFNSSDSSGEGGGVAFWLRSLFCGESSTRAARPPSLGPGPGASVTGRNTPTPWAWQRTQRNNERGWQTELEYLKEFLPAGRHFQKHHNARSLFLMTAKGKKTKVFVKSFLEVTVKSPLIPNWTI